MGNISQMKIVDMGFSEALGIVKGQITILAMTEEERRAQCEKYAAELSLAPELAYEVMMKGALCPILLFSKPGVGKTTALKSLVTELNKTLPPERQWGFKKLDLATKTVGSLDGIPIPNSKEESGVMYEQIPELPYEGRDPEHGVILLDEITTADVAQAVPALSITDSSRSIGKYKLPDGWLVVGAGNGPDCANFIQISDASISRCSAINISYSFKDDWRPWARNHGIDPLILAYLSFQPESIISGYSTEETNDAGVGSLFACPRTWENLSCGLRLRAITGNPVSADEMLTFAGRFVGTEIGNKFAAFARFRNDSVMSYYNAKDICEGKGTMASTLKAKMAEPITVEQYHIVFAGLLSQLQYAYSKYEGHESDPKIKDMMFSYFANALKWLFDVAECNMLEYVIEAVVSILGEVPGLSTIFLFDEEFDENYCPEIDTFTRDHEEVLTAVSEHLRNMASKNKKA